MKEEVKKGEERQIKGIIRKKGKRIYKTRQIPCECFLLQNNLRKA